MSIGARVIQRSGCPAIRPLGEPVGARSKASLKGRAIDSVCAPSARPAAVSLPRLQKQLSWETMMQSRGRQVSTEILGGHWRDPVRALRIDYLTRKEVVWFRHHCCGKDTITIM